LRPRRAARALVALPDRTGRRDPAAMRAAFCGAAPALGVAAVRRSVATAATNSTCGAAGLRGAAGAGVTRRAALGVLGAAVAARVLSGLEGATAAEPPPGLPDGARQFNNLRAAVRQWGKVGGVLRREGEIGEEEWGNLRGYLRVFFRVGEDMEFLARGWDGARRERVKEMVKRVRKVVKEMDKVGGEATRGAFLATHGEVAGLLDEFSGMLNEDRGDVPMDL
jgi:hypothetical protein